MLKIKAFALTDSIGDIATHDALLLLILPRTGMLFNLENLFKSEESTAIDAIINTKHTVKIPYRNNGMSQVDVYTC